MADKTYINKCWIREKKFDNGGSVLNCGFYVDELKEHKIVNKAVVQKIENFGTKILANVLKEIKIFQKI